MTRDLALFFALAGALLLILIAENGCAIVGDIANGHQFDDPPGWNNPYQ